MDDIGPERRIIQVRPITKPVLPGTPDTLTYGAEPAAAPGLAVEEEPEPRTPPVGAPHAGGVIAAVAGAVMITAAALVVRWIMLAEHMWCTEDDTILGGVTRCLPVTDTEKTVLTWMGIGLLGLIWVRVAVAVLQYRSTASERAAPGEDRSNGVPPR